MIRFANWLGHWSVDVYLLGSVLLILALLATATLRQPVHRLAITKSLFIALALLAALCAVPGWSVLHLLTAKPPAPIESAQSAMPLIGPADMTNEVRVTNRPPTTPIFAPPPTPAQTLPHTNLNAWTFAGAIELLGALAVLMRLAAGWAAAGALRRHSHEAPPGIQELLQQIATASPSKHAATSQIFISNRLNVPVALGLARPTIVLPDTMVDSPSALAPILAHELAHIQNRDLHWLALSRLLLVIFWPQPLYWFARRRMRLDQESLADAAAADLTTREKYAEQLVAWARNLTNTYPARLASAVGLWEGASQLRQRVALLLDDRITILRDFSRKWQLSTIGLCTILAASLSLITLRPAQSQSREKTAGQIISSPPTYVPGPPFEKRSVAPNSIAVRVVDERGEPIEKQRVDLYRLDLVRGKSAIPMMATLTNNDGTATFSDIIRPDNAPFAQDYPNGKIEARPGLYGQLAVLVKSPGHASWLTPLDEVGVFQTGGKIVIRLTKSASLKGRITNTQGEPVAGAIVSTVAVDIPGFRTATTDNDGRYELADEAAVDLGGESTTTKDTNTFAAGKDHVSVLQLNLLVRHPDYAEKLVPCTQIPSTVDARLERGGTIEGRVVLADQDTNPINVGTRVCAEEAPTGDARRKSDPTRPAYAGIDANGHFRIGPLRPGRYSLFSEKTGWFNSGVNAGLRDIDVKAGEATTAPDLTLSVGSTVHVQLIDASSHQPISLENETRGTAIIVPKPGTNGRTIDRPINVNQDGRFDIRMPAGACGLSVSVGDWRVNANEREMFDVAEKGSTEVKLEASNKQQQNNDRSSREQPAATNAKPTDEKDDITGAVFQSATPPGVPNNIDGQCIDETGKPLAGVAVLLARASWDGTSRQEVAKQTTGPDGQFRFADVVDIHREYPDGKIPKFPNQNIATFQIATVKPGRESYSELLDQAQVAGYGAKMHVVMGSGATLRGQVTNPDGKPVAGALVSVGSSQLDRWEGFQTVRTKADGSYEITDAPTLKVSEKKDGSLKDQSAGTFSLHSRAADQSIFVTQTQYADRPVRCQGIPGTQDIQLKPATIIRGRVIDGATKKPVAKLRVMAIPNQLKGGPDVELVFAFTTTDANGDYQIHTLPAGTYNLWAIDPDRVNKGIKDLKTSGDSETKVPDLVLTTGGILRVRLINDKTNQPVEFHSDDYAQIGVEPFAPYSVSGYTAPHNGRFDVRVMPGDVHITSVGATSNGELRWLDRPGDNISVHVDDGQTVDVDVRVQKFDANAESKAAALFKSGMAAQRAGDDREALAAYDEIIALDLSDPENVKVYNLDARLLATSADDNVRDGKRAVKLAEQAIQLYGKPEPQLLGTLAAAYAETRDFDKAIETQKKAIDLAAKENRDGEFRPALKLHESHQPRQPKPAPNPSHKQGAASQPNKPSPEEDKPTTSAAKTADTQFNVVIAKHALLLGGNELTTWEQLNSKVGALPDPSKAQLHFYSTNGALEAGDQQALHNKIYPFSKKLKLQGHSEGTLLPRAGARYDRIEKQSDLAPDPSLRVAGTVLDTKNQPVAGAEVVLIAPVDESLPYKDFDITLVEGRIRNPLDEIMTVSDEAGHFAVYPPKGEKYRLLVSHPNFGFNLTDDESFASTAKVTLLPWAKLTCVLGAEEGEKQSASLSTRPHSRAGYPNVTIEQNWEDLKLKAPANTFSYAHVPVILQTDISRSFAQSDGSVSISAASVSLLPDEDRQIDLGSMSGKQREWLQWNREQFKNRNASPQTDGTAPRPILDSKPGTDEASTDDKKTSEDSRDDSKPEDIKRKLTAPLLATMAKDNVYELKPDQDLRRVAPPFAPIRLKFYGADNPLQADVLPQGPDSVTFIWNDGTLQENGMFFNGAKGYDLPNLVDSIFGLPRQQIEGPPELLRDTLPGDWVIRKDADETALAAQLQHILQTEFSQPIKLHIATVERSVYIAHGNFTGSPIPVSWAKKYPPRPRTDSLQTADFPGEGPGQVNLFLNWVGAWIQTPIVSEVKDEPTNIVFRLKELRDNLEHGETHHAERILADLTTQTGIEFTPEKRKIKMMFVETRHAIVLPRRHVTRRSSHPSR